MALRFPDIGESIALQLLVNKINTPEDLVLRLFKNDLSYDEGIDENDLTEADFSGYSAITLTGASWTVSEDDPTEITYAQQTFESDADQSPQTIYGHYYTLSSSGTLVAVNKYDVPIVIENDGDRIRITPRITAEDTGD